MNHRGTQKLETERLILRRLTEADAEAMFRNWASDPEVTRYNGPLVKTTYEKNIVNKAHCLIPEEAA